MNILKAGMNWFIKFSITLLISLSIALLLMCMAFSIPVERISNNVAKSATILTNEGQYYSPIPFVQGTQLDNYTETVYLNEALIGPRQMGILKGALSGARYIANEDDDSAVNLADVVNNKENIQIQGTSRRFWNGYIIPLKILLLITDYSGIRELNTILQISLIVILIYLLQKKRLAYCIAPVTLAFLFVKPFIIAFSMTLAGFLYCTVIPCIFMLLFNDAIQKKNFYYLFFEMVGICTFFFNMNYCQLVTFAAPLLLYFLMNGIDKNCFKKSLALFVAWFFGYAGMMIGKWALYTCFIDNSIIREVTDSMLFRMGAGNVDDFTRLDAILINIGRAFGDIWWLIFEFAFICFCIFRIRKNKNMIRPSKVEIGFFAFLCILPIIRYLIFANHVYVHNFITYRLMVIAVLSVNVFLARRIQSDE